MKKAVPILSSPPCVAVAACLMLSALGGCSKAEHVSAGAAQSTRSAQKRAPPGGAPQLRDMVRAVSVGRTPTEIDLKFALQKRPLLGAPVDIDIALIPVHDLDHISATFSATDGLEVSQGAKMPQTEHPEVGVPISHTLTIVPQRDGIFFVNATVLADSSTNSVTRRFSIPVIAGTGLGQGAPPAAVAPSALPTMPKRGQ